MLRLSSCNLNGNKLNSQQLVIQHQSAAETQQASRCQLKQEFADENHRLLEKKTECQLLTSSDPRWWSSVERHVWEEVDWLHKEWNEILWVTVERPGTFDRLSPLFFCSRFGLTIVIIPLLFLNSSWKQNKQLSNWLYLFSTFYKNKKLQRRLSNYKNFKSSSACWAMCDDEAGRRRQAFKTPLLWWR